jgi:hypothetical protein
MVNKIVVASILAEFKLKLEDETEKDLKTNGKPWVSNAALKHQEFKVEIVERNIKTA